MVAALLMLVAVRLGLARRGRVMPRTWHRSCWRRRFQRRPCHADLRESRLDVRFIDGTAIKLDPERAARARVGFDDAFAAAQTLGHGAGPALVLDSFDLPEKVPEAAGQSRARSLGGLAYPGEADRVRVVMNA